MDLRRIDDEFEELKRGEKEKSYDASLSDYSKPPRKPRPTAGRTRSTIPDPQAPLSSGPKKQVPSQAPGSPLKVTPTL
jgi:hypothetical protein